MATKAAAPRSVGAAIEMLLSADARLVEVDALVSALLESTPEAELLKELQKLDVARGDHVAAYVPVLCALTRVVRHTGDVARRVLSDFRRLCCALTSSQIRMLPARFATLARAAAHLAHERGEAMSLLLPMRSAMSKFAPSPSHYTPLHAAYLGLCVSAQAYEMARAIKSPYLLDSRATAMDAVDMQLYLYYSCLVCFAARDCDGALRNTELLIALPAVKVTEVAVEAYKKHMLAHAIVSDAEFVKPKTRLGEISAEIVHLCETYSELATAAGKGKMETLLKIVQDNADLFINDGNFGLVKQVLYAVRKRHIQRLTRTYLTLSLSEIASRVHLPSPASAQQLLVGLIERDDVNAGIDEATGMVTFEELSPMDVQHRARGGIKSLDEHMQRCLECMDQIVAFRDRLPQEPSVNDQRSLPIRSRAKGASSRKPS